MMRFASSAHPAVSAGLTDKAPRNRQGMAINPGIEKIGSSGKFVGW
jgi:hypothetical protein